MNRRTFILASSASIAPGSLSLPPPAGATTSVSQFASLAEEIQNYIKMRMPEWERLYPGRQLPSHLRNFASNMDHCYRLALS